MRVIRLFSWPQAEPPTPQKKGEKTTKKNEGLVHAGACGVSGGDGERVTATVEQEREGRGGVGEVKRNTNMLTARVH